VTDIHGGCGQSCRKPAGAWVVCALNLRFLLFAQNLGKLIIHLK
jgi:hypothetical protein